MNNNKLIKTFCYKRHKVDYLCGYDEMADKYYVVIDLKCSEEEKCCILNKLRYKLDTRFVSIFNPDSPRIWASYQKENFKSIFELDMKRLIVIRCHVRAKIKNQGGQDVQ